MVELGAACRPVRERIHWPLCAVWSHPSHRHLAHTYWDAAAGGVTARTSPIMTPQTGECPAVIAGICASPGRRPARATTTRRWGLTSPNRPPRVGSTDSASHAVRRTCQCHHVQCPRAAESWLVAQAMRQLATDRCGTSFVVALGLDPVGTTRVSNRCAARTWRARSGGSSSPLARRDRRARSPGAHPSPDVNRTIETMRRKEGQRRERTTHTRDDTTALRVCTTLPHMHTSVPIARYALHPRLILHAQTPGALLVHGRSLTSSRACRRKFRTAQMVPQMMAMNDARNADDPTHAIATRFSVASGRERSALRRKTSRGSKCTGA